MIRKRTAPLKKKRIFTPYVEDINEDMAQERKENQKVGRKKIKKDKNNG